MNIESHRLLSIHQLHFVLNVSVSSYSLYGGGIEGSIDNGKTLRLSNPKRVFTALFIARTVLSVEIAEFCFN